MKQLKQIFGDDVLSFDELISRLECADLHYINAATLPSNAPESAVPAALPESSDSGEDTVLAADGLPSCGRAAEIGEARSVCKSTLCTNESEQISALQNELDALRLQHSAELDSERLSHAVDVAISAARARDIEAVRPFIKFDSLKYDNGKVVGLEEQLRALKASKSYLFEGEVPLRSGIRQSGRGVTANNAANDALRSVFKR